MNTASPLLLLPGELRNRIYDYALPDVTAEIASISRSPLALSLACRQLYNETHTLAWAATAFRASRWTLAALQANIRKVRLSLRPLIKKLEIAVDVCDFLAHPRSLDGLKFADAGLTGLEELYITFSGTPKSQNRENYIISNLLVVIWKTIHGNKNECLRKIRVVHAGSLRSHGNDYLCDMMGKRLLNNWMQDGSWKTVLNLADGNHRIIHQRKDGTIQREVLVLFGHTAQEAEMYAEVKEQLLNVSRWSNMGAV
jgi:hypothetical protein